MKAFLSGLFIVLLAAIAQASDEGDDQIIQACLKHWGKSHPFKGKHPEFRRISAKVKVMGIGGDLNDEEKTSKPELVLVKPSVAVMSKSSIKLMNPNGWYCLKGRVAVLGKSEVSVHCDAKIASSSDGAAVLGSSEGKGGVAILGSSEVKRVGCKE